MYSNKTAIITGASSGIGKAIAPTVIGTPLYDDLMGKEQLESLSNLHPLRKLGQLADFTSRVLRLACDGSSFVTDQTLFVDGGITAGSHIK